jgi:hypothetical protein
VELGDEDVGAGALDRREGGESFEGEGVKMVPTTAATLCRVRTERKSPKLAIAIVGTA